MPSHNSPGDTANQPDSTTARDKWIRERNERLSTPEGRAEAEREHEAAQESYKRWLKDPETVEREEAKAKEREEWIRERNERLSDPEGQAEAKREYEAAQENLRRWREDPDTVEWEEREAAAYQASQESYQRWLKDPEAVEAEERAAREREEREADKSPAALLGRIRTASGRLDLADLGRVANYAVARQIMVRYTDQDGAEQTATLQAYILQVVNPAVSEARKESVILRRARSAVLDRDVEALTKLANHDFAQAIELSVPAADGNEGATVSREEWLRRREERLSTPEGRAEAEREFEEAQDILRRWQEDPEAMAAAEAKAHTFAGYIESTLIPNVQRRQEWAAHLREETPEGVITREDADGDGKIDRTTLTDPDGNVARETRYHYADDGTIDRIVVTTAEGVETHRDADGDGRIDRIVAPTPEGTRVHIDSDGDGAFDTVEVRDREGNVLSSTVHADTDGDGAVDQATVTTPEGTRVHNDRNGDGIFDNVPDAGSAGDAVDIFDSLANGGSAGAWGLWSREQGTGTWHDVWDMKDDSGINLVGAIYQIVNENTIIADGTVALGGGGTGRVKTTYTRNPDGTITTESRLVNRYAKDDAPGSGGGGSREYTVAADGSVRYTEGVHTYTVNDDDLRNAVIDAMNTGDATGLSSVDTTTVTNSDGQVMAHSLSRTDAIDAAVTTAQGVFNPYQPTANDGTPHPESGQPVYFDGAGNAFYDAGLSNPADDQAQAYFSGMLDTDRDGVPDSRDGVAGSMGNEFTVAVPDHFLPDAVRPAIPTVGDIQANAAALPAAAARGIDTTGLSISDISQKVFIHDQTAFVEQFLGPDAVPDGQAPTPEQLAQAQGMYDVVASLNAQVPGFTIGRETSGLPPAGVEVGGRQGFDQGLALAELQVDLQRVAEGKSSLPAVLAKWQADPRGSTLMLEGPRERLYGEEVGEYEGLPTTISATEWLTQAVAAETAQFENTFRQVTRREPSGDRVRDAAVLSQYGENPLTDMGYAAEVQAFENIFRQVTGREPSGDLARDADILRRYGENAVTDMGYAGEVRQFENIFRQVTGREPSGDLARDAAVLSQYGENPLTDMGYAGEVRQFEKTFREVTGREPSGDLAKDADILSRYGDNPLTDMGHAAEVREQDYGSVGHDNVSGPLVAPVEPLPEEERYEQLFQQGVKGYQADMIVAAEIEAGTTLAGDPGDRPSRLAVVQEMVEPRPTRDQFPGGPDGYQEFLSTDREWRANFDPFLREHIPANDPRAADLAVAAALAPLPGFWIPAIAGASYYTAASLVPDSPSGRSIRPQELIDPALEALPLAGKGLRFGRSALRQLTGLELNPWSVTRGNVTTQRFTLTEPASDIAEATARYDEMVRQAGFDPVEVRQQIGGYGALRAGLDPNPYAGELGYMIQDVILTGQPRSMVLGDKLLEVAPPSLARRLGGLDFHATPSGGVFADATTVRASSTNPVEMPIFSGPHAYPRFAAGPAFSSGPYQVTDAQDNLLTDFAGQPVMSKGSFEPSVIGRDPANVEVLPKIYPIRLKGGNVIYVKETEVIRPPGAELPAAQYTVPIGGDKFSRRWLPRTDYVSDLERSLDVRVDSAPLMFRSDVPFTHRDIVAANLQSYMDRVGSGMGDLGSIQGIRSKLASSSDPLAEAMPGGGTLSGAPGDADFSWVDEAPSDLSRTARQQVAGLDDSGLERMANDPTASPDLRDAASELLDVRRSGRAKISEEWVNDAVDSMVREARADVAMLGDAELRRLASDPSQLPDIRRAANELITLRETARADGISRQVEAERGVSDARSLVERPREVAPREAYGHLFRAGWPTLDLRIPDARIPDARIPDARIPDARIPDARIPDARIPDARIPDARVPDARIPDARVPDARVPDARVPDARVPDAHVPDARVPDAHVPDARIPDARIPDPRIPDARVPDARVPDPLNPDPRIPEVRTPDITRQRRVRLPEVDGAPMTVVKAEEGLYPRVVAHDELIRVYHDLDTGEVRTEPLAMPTEPIVVKHDDTPPPIESRFAGHRRITPRGGYVFTKPVGERRRKASSKRHPYLRKGELRRR